MDQPSSAKLDSEITQKRLRSDETEKIEHCIEELKKAYDSTRETVSDLSKAFPHSKNRLCDLELPNNCFTKIAEKLPQSMTQLMEIDQMTEVKYKLFGAQFLAICKKYINFPTNSTSFKPMCNNLAGSNN